MASAIKRVFVDIATGTLYGFTNKADVDAFLNENHFLEVAEVVLFHHDLSDCVFYDDKHDVEKFYDSGRYSEALPITLERFVELALHYNPHIDACTELAGEVKIVRMTDGGAAVRHASIIDHTRIDLEALICRLLNATIQNIKARS